MEIVLTNKDSIKPKGPECRDACRCPAGLRESARGGDGVRAGVYWPHIPTMPVFPSLVSKPQLFCILYTQRHTRKLSISPAQEYLQPRKSISPQSLRIFVEKGQAASRTLMPQRGALCSTWENEIHMSAVSTSPTPCFLPSLRAEGKNISAPHCKHHTLGKERELWGSFQMDSVFLKRNLEIKRSA